MEEKVSPTFMQNHRELTRTFVPKLARCLDFGDLICLDRTV